MYVVEVRWVALAAELWIHNNFNTHKNLKYYRSLRHVPQCIQVCTPDRYVLCTDPADGFLISVRT